MKETMAYKACYWTCHLLASNQMVPLSITFTILYEHSFSLKI